MMAVASGFCLRNSQQYANKLTDHQRKGVFRRTTNETTLRSSSKESLLIGMRNSRVAHNVTVFLVVMVTVDATR